MWIIWLLIIDYLARGLMLTLNVSVRRSQSVQSSAASMCLSSYFRGHVWRTMMSPGSSKCVLLSPARGGHTTPVLTLTVGSSGVAPPSYQLGGVATCWAELWRHSLVSCQEVDQEAWQEPSVSQSRTRSWPRFRFKHWNFYSDIEHNLFLFTFNLWTPVMSQWSDIHHRVRIRHHQIFNL